MVAEAVYLDLSSSDEDEEDHNQNPNGWADSTGLSYLSKVCVLHAEEEDVVIIDKPTSTDKLKRDKPRVIRAVMDDDECCMLDTDPSATETTDCTPPLDSDELVMTGEKGPVACRDFPHARYLCVHFPFKTTLHANFCTQCHCYVCDSLAPCPMWGDGNSAGDHCHASEESPWKALRKLAKCGPVSSSRATPIPAATVATQSGITVSNINGITTPMGVSVFVPPSILQAHATSLSPVSESPVVGPSPVGLGISLPVRGNTTTTTGPLVIRLNPKGRGKPSQRPHLGVRSPKPPYRSSPVSVFSRNNRSLPVPRSRPVPSERVADPVLPIPAQIPQPLQQAQFYVSPGAERTGSGTAPFPSQQLPPFNTVPSTAGGAPVMTPPVNFPHTLGSSNVAPYYPFQAPPLPNSPPPYIPPPPPPAFTSGAYNIPSPAAVYDQFPMQQLPAADASVAGFVSHIPDSTYVSPSDQQVQMAPHYEDYAFALPRSNYSTDYAAQDYKSPVVETACYAATSYDSSHGGNTDILEGPTEGWAAEAASLFDSFTSGVNSDPNQQSATSLEKVLEQMAGDDYLWEQFSSW